MLIAVIENKVELLIVPLHKSVVLTAGILRLATTFLMPSVAAKVCSFEEVQLVGYADIVLALVLPTL